MCIYSYDLFFRMYLFILFPLIFCNDVRAAAVGDEVETVEATEGEIVTLKTDWTGLMGDDIILWTFGTEGTRIGRLFNNKTISNYVEKFRDRLHLDTLTGSLTISNIRTSDTGLYKVQLSSENTSVKLFTVTVYATLPKPNITREYSKSWSASNSSSPGCSVVCFVNNGYRVTLSWYNEDHQHSYISETNNSILSLTLNFEHCDERTYSCVAANPIINQTVELKQSTHCSCSVNTGSIHLLSWLIPVLLLLVVIVTVIYLFYLKSSKERSKVRTPDEEIVYTETVFCQRLQPMEHNGSEDIVYSGVNT